MQAPDSLAAQDLPLRYNDSDSDLSDLSTMASGTDSELSSIGSRSPSPPPGYMSPVSSQGTESRDSSDESKKKKRSRADGDENAPVRKKRRTPELKERVRQDLNLTSDDDISEQDAQLQTLLRVLRKRRKIVVVAGAGISVSAGSEFLNPVPATKTVANITQFLISDRLLVSSRH